MNEMMKEKKSQVQMKCKYFVSQVTIPHRQDQKTHVFPRQQEFIYF